MPTEEPVEENMVTVYDSTAELSSDIESTNIHFIYPGSTNNSQENI